MIWGVYINGTRYIPYAENISNSQQLYDAVLRLSPSLFTNRTYTLPFDISQARTLISSSTPHNNPDGSTSWTGDHWYEYKDLKSGEKIKLTSIKWLDSDKEFSINFNIIGDKNNYNYDTQLSTSNMVKLVLGG